MESLDGVFAVFDWFRALSALDWLLGIVAVLLIRAALRGAITFVRCTFFRNSYEAAKLSEQHSKDEAEIAKKLKRIRKKRLFKKCEKILNAYTNYESDFKNDDIRIRISHLGDPDAGDHLSSTLRINSHLILVYEENTGHGVTKYSPGPWEDRIEKLLKDAPKAQAIRDAAEAKKRLSKLG
jgi:hypothetical protein